MEALIAHPGHPWGAAYFDPFASKCSRTLRLPADKQCLAEIETQCPQVASMSSMKDAVHNSITAINGMTASLHPGALGLSNELYWSSQLGNVPRNRGGHGMPLTFLLEHHWALVRNFMPYNAIREVGVSGGPWFTILLGRSKCAQIRR
jgi:hypothetical protein